jgi:signal transduction histidine kinase
MAEHAILCGARATAGRNGSTTVGARSGVRAKMNATLRHLPFDRSVLARFAGDPPEVRRRARLVLAFAVLAFTGGNSLGLSHYLWFGIPLAVALPPVLAGVISLAAPWYLVKTRSLTVAGHVLAGCWLLACGWGMWVRGGLSSPPIYTQIAAPFIALTIIGRRAAVLWLGVISVEVAVYVALLVAGIAVPDRMQPQYQLSSNLFAASLFGILVLAMGLALEWLREAAQAESAQAQSSKLAAERETAMLRADRLASLGHLAASMAHEINNPLSYMIANLDYLLSTVPAGDQREVLADALEGASRVRTIVHDLKTFARGDDEKLRPVDLAAVVSSSVRLVAGQAKHITGLRTKLGDCPLVLADETRLGQVLVNLLVNSIQAFPDDGSRGHEIVVSLGRAPDGAARLSVRDNGCGIPAEVLSRVTEPFWTSKPVGVGTGLGLSVCDNLIRRYRGALKIESAVGAGTTVTVELPAAPPGREHAARAAPSKGGLQIPLRVLVVDDDAPVLRAIGRMLKGHQVTLAGGGGEALEVLARRDDFDLVICDLMMPGISGVEVAKEIAARHAGLIDRLVFVSGGATTDSARSFLGSAAHPILGKPLEAAALDVLVAEMMARV